MLNISDRPMVPGTNTIISSDRAVSELAVNLEKDKALGKQAT
jgi:hypothetical protein